MLSRLFLGMSLLGAEWVLYLLVGLSLLSITLIAERWLFYRSAGRGLDDFRTQLRNAAGNAAWSDALNTARARQASSAADSPDLEAGMAVALLEHSTGAQGEGSTRSKDVEVLEQLARDAIMRNRITWDRNLSILATIGSNAPFVGLFGTVLGIIKAFHDLSQQAQAGAASGVTAGISEALVATAVGIMVAIPAVVAYNLFQRRVRNAAARAEALKSYLIGKIAG